jgi:hypothetical protein
MYKSQVPTPEDEIRSLKKTIAELTNEDVLLPPLNYNCQLSYAMERRKKALERLKQNREITTRLKEEIEEIKQRQLDHEKQVEKRLDCLQDSLRLHMGSAFLHFEPGVMNNLSERVAHIEAGEAILQKQVAEATRNSAFEDMSLIGIQDHLNKMQESLEALSEILYELPSETLFQAAKEDFKKKEELRS